MTDTTAKQIALFFGNMWAIDRGYIDWEGNLCMKKVPKVIYL